MTHEEAKKIGATHYVDAAGIGIVYIKYINSIGFYWHDIVGKWIKCNPHLDGIKPLGETND